MSDWIELTHDRSLTANDIGQLENNDEIIRFFAQLGYDVDDALPLSHAALGLDTEDLAQAIQKIYRIGADPVDGDVTIYLMEVRSISMTLFQAVARRLRTRPDLALIVFTKAYEMLDFVLFDRIRERSNQLGQPFKEVIRPRTLSVNRRDPSRVHLRVLRRFTCTEADGPLQWEKLRSAYTLAEWSEEHFNNRALFSDHYLKTRLTEPSLTPAWAEDVRPAGREVFKLMTSAAQRFTGQPLAQVEVQLYRPLFHLLGFDAIPQANAATPLPPHTPLYAVGDPSKPLAVVLTCSWNRNLDDVDPGRDEEAPNAIPGALVVSLLEASVAPWAIVTNGKCWRLYSATADNKATNYYEIDLEEALAAPDQVTALQYWWLFFRVDAFTGLLDEVLRGSADYAKELGERLKQRVFTEIFPHFAEGFIKASGEGDLDLELVFQATLTFLYRLMFALYAESLDLLPLAEIHGYGEYSLYLLKRAIADHGGNNEHDAPEKLRRAYSATSTALYKRLQRLFSAIDQGDQTLNLPAYNGGLFSSETPAGRFLAQHAVPDRYLALGLDRLCRDEDDKRLELVFVDFKSLGVRHLGSIYEGLLEFKLRIASEKLVVVKEKGKEVYLPAAQAKNQRVLASLDKDDVYLENDKRERKATGSYYTPDYIVKYIVQHTVGPVLERKFDELAPRLHATQSSYRQSKARAEAKREDPEKFWNREEMRHLADACLDVKVLDPAMGSGHFLVEVVDYVSNRLIDWLNGWSENPVWAMLTQMRADILNDLESQGVTVDAARLTRVALLKRAVLKRCVYGVDLNPMAVELAKVSLWLDAFTLGAPLSFLDHHLKLGNSLIGSRIQEVQEALKGDVRGGMVQSNLLSGGQWAGIMLATDLMRQVSYLSDNTPEQVRASRDAFRSAADHLAPYKRILDVYTSRWIGNPPSRKGFDFTVEFLNRQDTQAWIKDPTTSLPEKDYMNAHQVAATALRATEEKRFFHWELEFPEVFFAPSTPGGQDVQLREDGGFDAVVGNPPYDVLKRDPNKPHLNEFVDYARSVGKFSGVLSRMLNLFHLMYLEAVILARSQRSVAMIVPLSLLSDQSASGLRRLLLIDEKIIDSPYAVIGAKGCNELD